jgi:hypothetical protein
MKTTDFTITLTDIEDILASEIKRFNPKLKLCGKCDYYDSQYHAGLKCTKCSGEFVNVSSWTIYNLFKRVKKHFKNNHDRGQEATWFIGYFAYFLEEKGANYGKAYSWAFDNYKTIKPLFIQGMKKYD